MTVVAAHAGNDWTAIRVRSHIPDASAARRYTGLQDELLAVRL